MKRVMNIAILVVLCVSMSSCGAQNIEIDTSTLISDLLEQVSFEDELAQINAAMVSNLYDVPDGVTATVYVGSGATAEEIAVFEAQNKEDASNMFASALAHIDTQKESFQNYIPKEAQRLEHAIVTQKGTYVVVCVTDDETATNIIEASVK